MPTRGRVVTQKKAQPAKAKPKAKTLAARPGFKIVHTTIPLDDILTGLAGEPPEAFIIEVTTDLREKIRKAAEGLIDPIVTISYKESRRGYYGYSYKERSQLRVSGYRAMTETEVKAARTRAISKAKRVVEQRKQSAQDYKRYLERVVTNAKRDGIMVKASIEVEPFDEVAELEKVLAEMQKGKK